jgi:RNA polymerase sigma-70 factor (ECF subfamily)
MKAQQISQLLDDWGRGNQSAFDQLVPLVYDDLRRLACRFMRSERPDHTLQTTALIHEAYLKLAGRGREPWEGRKHFFAVAARVMRQVLIDHARGIRRAKRGGGAVKVPIEEAVILSPDRSVDIIALDEALSRLEAKDERKSRVVEMRIFAGLENSEIAEVLGVSPNTVIRDWNFAQAWLRSELAS